MSEGGLAVEIRVTEFYPAGQHVRHIVMKNICALEFGVVLDFGRVKARGKKSKRKRGRSMSFSELVQKLWQPESEELEPKVDQEKKKERARKHRRIRKK